MKKSEELNVGIVHFCEPWIRLICTFFASYKHFSYPVLITCMRADFHVQRRRVPGGVMTGKMTVEMLFCYL